MVIRKRTRESSSYTSGLQGDASFVDIALDLITDSDTDTYSSDVAVGRCSYYVTFGSSKGEIEFQVSEALYIELEQGDEGLLVYKGEKFMHFIRGVYNKPTGGV